eukprot:2123399-Ditylum_brightwellii.AAC.1
MQPDNLEDDTKFIHELSKRMDAMEHNLETQEKKKTSVTTRAQKDLLKSIIDRTAQLEAKANKDVPQEVAQMLKHTKHLEEKQKGYDDWKAMFLAELKDRFQAQSKKIDCMEDHL